KEACVAHRIIVPSNKVRPDQPGFAFWLSPSVNNGRGSGALCLLEDSEREDGLPQSFARASTYTLLQSLVYYTRAKLRDTVLAPHLPNLPHPNAYANFDDKPASLAEYHNVEAYCSEFIRNFGDLLTNWGCEVSPGRRIETLYRIREFGRDSTSK